jgi:hypothetical protein
VRRRRPGRYEFDWERMEKNFEHVFTVPGGPDPWRVGGAA